ncbi:MAG: hypothetical protein N4A76_17535 [Firmicutes bacterium]|nr:hypothetical protein [Bacillota bacterium]
MRKYVNSEAVQHNMKLMQMGADVHQINSKMCYVSFELEDVKVAYVYNINSKGKYFLERIKPYPLPIKAFDKEDDIIKIIRIDIEQFNNAKKSKNIDDFIEINSTLNKTIKKFEDLFLYYNVPGFDVRQMKEAIEVIDNSIEEIKSKSERIYFKKEPDNL